MSELGKFTLKIYAYKFFDKFMLIYPLYAVMFQDYNLEPIQIAFLFIAWKVTSFLLEFPSGVTADFFSRKKQLIIAEIMILIGYLIWMLFPNFWGFLAGFVLWGAKAALVSGTFEAFLYDELKALNQENLYTSFYGKLTSIATLAMGLAALMTYFIFNFGGYSAVLLICVISNAIATFSLMTLKETPITKSSGERKMFDLAKNGFKEIFTKKDLRVIVIFTALIIALGIPIDEYTNLLVVDAGLDPAYLGFFAAAMPLLTMIGSYFADKLENINEAFHYLLVILSSLLLLTAALLLNEFTIVLLLLEISLVPVIDVIFEGKTQKLISSEYRATISSIRTFIARAGSILIIFIVGLLTQAGSYRDGFIFLALLSLTVGVGFMIFLSLKKKNIAKQI